MPAEAWILHQITFRSVAAAVAVLLLAWLVIRWISGALEALSRKSRRARFFIKWIEPVLRIGIWFTALILCFHLLAPSRETFLASWPS